jgi:DNA-binding MarR family transcriptional regulator
MPEQLCFALYAATNAVVRAYRPRLQEIGLTYPQYLVMLVLWQYGTTSVQGIARRLELAANGIVPLIDRLEQGGRLRRERGQSDRRVVNIALTAAGEALEREARKVHLDFRAATGLSDTEMVRLRRELNDLCARISAHEPAVKKETEDA